ncbi:hypothetical protein PROFUN_06297 [Planoprotostelium fungivorum]|uniref:Uncharacterized protein n=1 Tax=Planoprotostelium fungivorum TaxID=1890364 RepID=A0A2P6NED1_9EUKA|nr:hypothetical protein PROFUN_06297 [Planoprotostelium fungivorum]
MNSPPPIHNDMNPSQPSSSPQGLGRPITKEELDETATSNLWDTYIKKYHLTDSMPRPAQSPITVAAPNTNTIWAPTVPLGFSKKGHSMWNQFVKHQAAAGTPVADAGNICLKDAIDFAVHLCLYRRFIPPYAEHYVYGAIAYDRVSLNKTTIDTSQEEMTIFRSTVRQMYPLLSKAIVAKRGTNTTDNCLLQSDFQRLVKLLVKTDQPKEAAAVSLLWATGGRYIGWTNTTSIKITHGRLTVDDMEEWYDVISQMEEKKTERCIDDVHLSDRMHISQDIDPAFYNEIKRYVYAQYHDMCNQISMFIEWKAEDMQRDTRTMKRQIGLCLQYAQLHHRHFFNEDFMFRDIIEETTSEGEQQKGEEESTVNLLSMTEADLDVFFSAPSVCLFEPKRVTEREREIKRIVYEVENESVIPPPTLFRSTRFCPIEPLMLYVAGDERVLSAVRIEPPILCSGNESPRDQWISSVGRIESAILLSAARIEPPIVLWHLSILKVCES